MPGTQNLPNSRGCRRKRRGRQPKAAQCASLRGTLWPPLNPAPALLLLPMLAPFSLPRYYPGEGSCMGLMKAQARPAAHHQAPEESSTISPALGFSDTPSPPPPPILPPGLQPYLNVNSARSSSLTRPWHSAGIQSKLVGGAHLDTNPNCVPCSALCRKRIRLHLYRTEAHCS